MLFLDFDHVLAIQIQAVPSNESAVSDMSSQDDAKPWEGCGGPSNCILKFVPLTRFSLVGPFSITPLDTRLLSFPHQDSRAVARGASHQCRCPPSSARIMSPSTKDMTSRLDEDDALGCTKATRTCHRCRHHARSIHRTHYTRAAIGSSPALDDTLCWTSR